MFKSVIPKPNFPELEKNILKYWDSERIVEKYLNRNKDSNKRFSFIDGPITANNPMGVHHAWGRTYKDLWQRYFNMKGYKQRFQNGFDCQGLWVEVEVEKELGLKGKKDIENLVAGDKKKSIVKFVDLCKQRVLKYAKIQTEQSKRLGYFMDWDHSYFTMSDENNYMIWCFLKVCHENGWIYKGTDVVAWCPRCETAISQHEVLTEDYKEVTHASVYLRLPVEGRKNEYLLIWTTTPWTIPANTAVAVDSDLEYTQVEDKKSDKYWIAKDLTDKVFGKDSKVIRIARGKDLIGLKYTGPYDHLPYLTKIEPKSRELFHTVVATDPVIMPISIEEGTGLVHTSTSTGQEDHKFGKKIGLPVVPAIDDRAYYLEGFGELAGRNAKENPEIILDYLKKNGWAFKVENYRHRYPACWRCKTELVWRLTDEWYIAMDRPCATTKVIGGTRSHKTSVGKAINTTLRKRMMEVAKKIRWIPKFGLERELDWLKNMHDWLISKKNRYWGLALPIWECKKCGYFEVISSKDELKKKAISGWEEFEGKSPHKPQIDEVRIKCGKCGQIISRIEPVGNPWLDAGIVTFSTLIDPKTNKLSYTSDQKYWQEWFPADFITESFPGQFKNWFYSLIAMSTVLENTPSFKTVLGFATLLGEDGRPMHKSWGNAIEFNEGADKIGVDVMRWMYVTHNPEDNLLFGFKKADETRRKFHLLVWNIYNFFVTYSNADQWKKNTTAKLKIENLHILDRWILSKLNQLVKTVTASLSNYDIFKASLAIEDFIIDLSTWYVRRSRDRVGPTAEDGEDKKACHATLYKVLEILMKIIAPFTPFLAEEIYTNLTDGESVHLVDYPVADESLIDTDLEVQMAEIRKIIELTHAERKIKNIKVRQPLSLLIYSGTSPLAYLADKPLPKELAKLIMDEVNVKEIVRGKPSGELSVSLDTEITAALKIEGEIRDLIRQIQLKRKEIGCSMTDKITVILPSWPKQYTGFIKKEILAEEIKEGKEIAVKRI